MLFGQRLLTERKKNNLSAQKLAKICGISRSYVTLIENGKRLPGRKIIPKLAAALHVKPVVVVNWYLEEVRGKLM